MRCGLKFWMSWGQGRGCGGCCVNVRFIGRGTSSTDHILNAMLAHRGSVGVVADEAVERCALFGKTTLRYH